MESGSVLESVAEVAIALAGFGGIAAGLGYRARGEWVRDDQIRLIGLAVFSLVVVFACFVPYVTHHLGSGAPLRMASAVFLPVTAFGWLFQIWFNRRGVPVGYSRVAALLNFSLQIAASVLLLAAVLGYAAGREFGLYLCAVLAMLLHTAVLFVRLLITSFRTG